LFFSFATAERANAVVGQPFLIADGDTAGSILDFFDIFGPSGVKELSLSGEVTDSVGAPGTIGMDLEFQSSVFGGSTLSLDGSSILVEDLTPGGSFDFDPFQGTPGEFTFNMLAMLPVDEFLDDVPNPGDLTFTYDAPWDIFGPYTSDFPELILVMTVFYDGDFPTKIYNDPGFGDIEYVEGAFDVTRITLGLDGGAPLPQVPVPASGLLLLGAIGALGARRRRA